MDLVFLYLTHLTFMTYLTFLSILMQNLSNDPCKKRQHDLQERFCP